MIGEFPAYSPELFAPAPRRRTKLAGGRGWRLDAARADFGPCLALSLRGGGPECVRGLRRVDSATAVVGCAPRVTVPAGTLARGTRSVRAVPRGGASAGT